MSHTHAQAHGNGQASVIGADTWVRLPATATLPQKFRDTSTPTIIRLDELRCKNKTEDLENTPAPSKNRRLVNFYVDPPMIVIGENSYENFWCHLDLHSKTRDYLSQRYDTSEIPQFFEESPSFISAFEDGIDFLIRVDIPASWHITQASEGDELPTREQKALDREKRIAMYRHAISMLENLLEGTSGRIYLETINDTPHLNLAKMIGRFDLVAPYENFSYVKALTFVNENTQELPGGEFYYAPWGTRFKTAEQVLKLLDDIDKPDVFMGKLFGMVEMMSPEKRSATAGVREAMFLVVDPITELVDNSKDTQAPLFEHLTRIFANCCELQGEGWSEDNKLKVKALVKELAEKLQSLNHVNFQAENCKNPVFITHLAKILRGAEKTQSMGEGFSTPLKSVKLGWFEKNLENGKKEFKFFNDVDPEHRAIAEHILAKNKDRNLDYLCLCVPLTPLTPEQHPSSLAEIFGDPEDHSFVILFGEADQAENRVVIRRSPWGRSNWRKQLVILNELSDHPKDYNELKSISPEVKSRIEDEINACQARLHHALFAPDENESQYSVPGFRGLVLQINGQEEDYQERDFINGARLDLETRTALSTQEIIKYAFGLGETAALNALCQRPNFPLHELLVVKDDITRKKIVSIGLHESFFNPDNFTTAKDYIDTTKNLYASSLASWLTALRFGDKGTKLSMAEIRAYEAEFISEYFEGFVSRFENAVKNRERWDSKVQAEVAYWNHLEKELPSQIPTTFDIRSNLWLTGEILTMSPRKFAGKIIAQARNLSRHFENVVEDIPLLDETGIPTTESREQLIRVVESLVANNYDHNILFERICNKILDGSFDYSHFSLPERQFLLDLADVGAWILKVAPKSYERAVQLVKKYHSDDEFAVAVETELGEHVFRYQSAKRFHAAVSSLSRTCENLQSGSERLRLLQWAIRRASYYEINFENAPYIPNELSA